MLTAARARGADPIDRPMSPPEFQRIAATAPLRLRGEYRPIAGRHDEMCRADGELRPHWEYLVGALEALGREEFDARREQARRLLNESGVTYNVYSDQPSADRLWPLDPLPLLITSAEWAAIERGVAQRAELLELLLADLYGPRRLVRSGVLPPELVFSHPGFLRPCDRVATPGGRRLHLYATDLARTPDGAMHVIGDRTQAPSGAGYALENRVVLSRVFPSLFRDSRVHRLALFFRSLRSLCAGVDPRAQGNPRIAVLTPGPENETYFEHAYLSAYLGYPLVQGSDLVVRDDRVWLEALDGLRPVDVLLRRVDDVYCDPLELRPDSLLGTAGLLQAARLGQVAIVNPLGSGVLENPGLLAYLPAVARELLGQDLAIPSVPTWWCGDDEARRYVLEHLDEMVIKPVAPHASAATVFGSELSTQERWRLAERVRDRPRLYVGQQRLALSTAPAVAEDRIEPRPMVLRSFAVAQEGGYLVMPGGLCRVAPRPDAALVSNQAGGVSKDVWVLASEPERQVSAAATLTTAAAPREDGDDVPARVADDLYWLGRYAERTDGTARLLREVVLRVLGSERAPSDDALPLLLRAVTLQTSTYPGFAGESGADRMRAPETELLAVLLDRRRPGSLRYDIDAVVRIGRAARDRLSSDASRVINALNREFVRPCDLSTAHESLQRVIFHLAAFAGLCSDSMSRGQGWRFLETGRSLERAVLAVGLLRALFVPAVRAGHGGPFEALLAIAHSLKTYRRRYRAQLEPGAVLELLLFDETNPRSAGYQLRELQARVGELSDGTPAHRGAAERLALDALTRVRLFDADCLAAPDTEPLEAVLEHVSAALAALSEELSRRYFSHAETPQQLVRIV